MPDDLYGEAGPPPTCCIRCRDDWNEIAKDAGVPFPLIVMRGMTLCPMCGNKRCPRASVHSLPCTGSNDPGQPGSFFPAIASQNKD